MKQNNILITGASGNIGGKVARLLLERGASLRLTGRNSEKLEGFQEQAQTKTGDLTNPTFLEEVLEGMTTVFLVMPRVGEPAIEAFSQQFVEKAKAAGVSHVVNISNCTLTRFGKPTALVAFEQYLSTASELHIKHLRCANFFENLNWGIHTPYREDIKLPYISSHEVAYVAAGYLEQLNFSGVSVDELMGRGDYSMGDFATKLGVTYQQLRPSPEDESFFEAFNSGAFSLVERTVGNTSTYADAQFTLEHFLERSFNKDLVAPQEALC